MPVFRIDLTEATFVRDFKDAKKRHPSVIEDVADVLRVLESDCTAGDWIPGIGAQVRKIRLGVKKQKIGKRSGYRLIYLVELDSKKITPLLLHYKPELALVPQEEIMKIIKGLSERQAPTAALSVKPDLLN